jgi:GTP-sensing pleiotropic transcriptional regulator CodY
MTLAKRRNRIVIISVVADRVGVLLSFGVKAVGRLTYPIAVVDSHRVLPAVANRLGAAR